MNRRSKEESHCGTPFAFILPYCLYRNLKSLDGTPRIPQDLLQGLLQRPPLRRLQELSQLHERPHTRQLRRPRRAVRRHEGVAAQPAHHPLREEEHFSQDRGQGGPCSFQPEYSQLPSYNLVVTFGYLQLPDHELFSISLETLLSTHFMYGDPEWHTRCVASARTSNMLGETQDENRRHKKFSGYVVYVAYRSGARSSCSFVGLGCTVHNLGAGWRGHRLLPVPIRLDTSNSKRIGLSEEIKMFQPMYEHVHCWASRHSQGFEDKNLGSLGSR